VAETESRIAHWRTQIADNAWFACDKATYFLGRGGALGSCYEARLLWEEGAKLPATALGTGSFRHGPQEMVTPDVRFGLWIDAHRMREQDLSVARDLRRLGASVMLIGQEIPDLAGDLVFQIPSIASDWQFLIDIIPAQLAAEHLARLQGVERGSGNANRKRLSLPTLHGAQVIARPDKTLLQEDYIAQTHSLSSHISGDERRRRGHISRC
ncbi:MAG: hypothetical protein DMG96_08260, partial [Acidobacteria bacterium]